jgi:hypothetical protein
MIFFSTKFLTLEKEQMCISYSYESNIIKPRNTIVIHKSYTHKLRVLFVDVDARLHDKLKKQIILSKDMNAYNEYKSTLNVIVTSLRHRKG